MISLSGAGEDGGRENLCLWWSVSAPRVALIEARGLCHQRPRLSSQPSGTTSQLIQAGTVFFFKKKKVYLRLYLLLCVRACVCVCERERGVCVRWACGGQRATSCNQPSPLLPPLRGFWVLNSHCQVPTRAFYPLSRLSKPRKRQK